MALYTSHERPLTVLFSDIAHVTSQLSEVFVGTPGSVIERTNAKGVRFYVHQYYDGERKQRERYLAGPVGQVTAETAADRLRDRIAEANDLVPSLRMLGREGYNLADPRTYATVATLTNHGVFEAGGILVGSHAYGILLNQLGARASAYQTHDIDIARAERLAFNQQPTTEFLAMVRESGIDFVPVPGLRRGEAPTSFKKKGKARFQIELLVPSQGDDYATVAIPELGVHATALPYLGYLLTDPQSGPLLSRVGACPVRLPLPERFATHKLIVSQLRANRDKTPKDIHQACALAARLAETHPGALADSVAAVPPSARSFLRKGYEAARPIVEASAPLAAQEWSTALHR